MHDRFPHSDPTAVLDEFRTAQISHLLVAAIVEFDVGAALAEAPLEFDDLCQRLALRERSAIVLLTALRSIGLVDVEPDGRLGLTRNGREKLDPASAFNLRGYIGLGQLSGDVQNMIACLMNDRPIGDVSFVYHDGADSALDDAATSDLLTRAMADRARNVAPYFADRVDLSGSVHLVDVGGAHGLYAFEALKRHPELRATILDRQPPLKVAAEYAEEAGLTSRVDFQFDDAHQAKLTERPDVVLMANLLHDYDPAVASRLVRHYAEQLKPGGQLLVLDSLIGRC